MPMPSLTAPSLLEVLRWRVGDESARPSFTFLVAVPAYPAEAGD
jgi:hypothetical protein